MRRSKSKRVSISPSNSIGKIVPQSSSIPAATTVSALLAEMTALNVQQRKILERLTEMLIGQRVFPLRCIQSRVRKVPCIDNQACVRIKRKGAAE